MSRSTTRKALLDWRVGAVVLSVLAAAVYWPAMNRVFVADQLWYFAEVGAHDSLALGIRHVDYAISRQYWKGDDLLFRPILFTWLAVANRLFSYHHVWWNVANLAIHVGVAVAMLRLLLAIQPSLVALPAAALFLVLEPPMELVLWNHLGGYLLACLFLAAGLRSFLRGMDGSGASYAGYAVAFTLAALSYEAMVPIAAAGALLLIVLRRGSSKPACPALLLLPVVVFSVLYVFHVLHAERLWYVDRADGRAPFDIANVGTMIGGIWRMLETWIRELSMPSALRLWSAPFERFGKAYDDSWTDPLQLANTAVVAAGLVLLWRSVSRARLSQVAPIVMLLVTGTLAYTFIIAFGRSAEEVAAITYYSYVFSVLAVPLVYALIDFSRLRGQSIVAAGAVVCGFAAFHAAGTAATARDVGRVNRDPSLFLTRVATFVDAHRSERDFSFAIEPHPESLDPTIGLVVGYPGDPGRPVLQHRVTEILFSPDYTDRDPKYLLSASAERVVRQRESAAVP
jgi:hypothetical protein